MANGTATPMSVNLNMATNRINSAGWAYDANGNTTAMPVVGGSATLTYDMDNRLATWTGPGGQERYGYLADNKRVWKRAPNGTETVYFYGVGGQKLVTYTLQSSPLALIPQTGKLYFGGKLIWADGVPVVHDRLGSVVWRGGVKHDYLPYGEEMGPSTAGNVEKFGTYHRDATTGLDYADQRYFAGLSGRFLSGDPYEASGGAAEPGSWNRYPYVGGDPVNFGDPDGLMMAPPGNGDELYGGSGGGGGGGNWWSWIPFFGQWGSPNPNNMVINRKITSEEKNKKVFQVVGALVAAWRAGESDEQDGQPYPKYLKVTSDTYSCFGKVVQRDVTYQLYGSDHRPLNSGVITETLFQTDYDVPIITRPAINSSSGQNNGVFEDGISNQLGPSRSYLQSFTVQGSSASLAGIANIPVYVVGFGGTYGVLSVIRTATYVEINGNRGSPKKCN